MNTNIVKIILWGRTVGYVYWDKRSKRAVFQYDEDYVADGFDLAPLTMSLHGEGMRHNRVWLGDTDKLYLGLPPLLADSLPDHWGNSIFKAWLRDNGIRSSDVTPVDDHSKNFTFCMDRNSVWRLSPAYDLTFAVDTSVPAYVNRHLLFVNGKNHDITVDDLLEIADRNDVRNPSELIRSVYNAIDDFKLIASDFVSADIINMVWSEIKR